MDGSLSGWIKKVIFFDLLLSFYLSICPVAADDSEMKEGTCQTETNDGTVQQICVAEKKQGTILQSPFPVANPAIASYNRL
jgi:hypothetical protein